MPTTILFPSISLASWNEYKAHETRDKISQSVQKAKEKASEKIVEFKKRHSA